MVVDDSPDVIFTIKHGLEDDKENYEIIGAESGIKCLQLLKENQLPEVGNRFHVARKHLKSTSKNIRSHGARHMWLFFD